MRLLRLVTGLSGAAVFYHIGKFDLCRKIPEKSNTVRFESLKTKVLFDILVTDKPIIGV